MNLDSGFRVHEDIQEKIFYFGRSHKMIFGGYKFHGVHGLVCLLVTLILMWLWFIKNITNSELGMGVTEWIPPVRVLSPLLTPKSVPTSTMKTTIEDFEQKINLPFLNPEKIKSPILDSKKSSEFLEDVKHWIKDKESQRPMQLGPKPHGYASMPLYTGSGFLRDSYPISTIEFSIQKIVKKSIQQRVTTA